MTVQTTQPLWEVKDHSDSSLIVGSTTDYSKFHIDTANRPINEKHVIELIEAIKEKNLLREYPIIVDRDFNIRDGQHRFLVAKDLGIPIYYIVSEDMSIEDVATANKHQANWKPNDYLRYWSARGNQNYIILNDFHETHPFLSVPMCRLLLSGHGQRQEKRFISGEFEVTRKELAEKVANYLKDFKVYGDLHTRFYFVAAMKVMVSNPRYDHARMLNKLSYLGNKLHRCVDTAEYLTMLSSIYNYHANKKDRVDFLADKNRPEDHRKKVI